MHGYRCQGSFLIKSMRMHSLLQKANTCLLYFLNIENQAKSLILVFRGDLFRMLTGMSSVEDSVACSSQAAIWDQ